MEAHVNDNKDKFFNFQKLLIFGDKNVGKSCFVTRICKADFDANYAPSPRKFL
jgi:GTPase SAR1 family protein